MNHSNQYFDRISNSFYGDQKFKLNLDLPEFVNLHELQQVLLHGQYRPLAAGGVLQL